MSSPTSIVRIVLASSAADRHAAFEVRHRVFVLEQGVPAELEVDPLDDTADHFVLYAGSLAVGAARLVAEEAGFADCDASRGAVAHLGRLAVRSDARGQGYGVALVRAVETRARALGLRDIVLAAQTHAIPFYERLGFFASGEVFDDAGLPHRWMRKSLNAAETPARGPGGRGPGTR